MTASSEPDPLRELRTLLAEGRYQEVLERHAAAATAWERREPGIALAVATAATRLGRLDEGESLAAVADEGFRSRADDDGRLRSQNLLGAIAWERGEVEDAVSRWTRALEIARSWGDTLMTARVSNNLASAVHLGGRAVEARSLYREAMLAYQRLGERRFVAESAHNLAITYRDEGELELALDAGAEAVRQAELTGDKALLALTITGRAETRVARNEPLVAGAELERAQRLAAEASDRVGVAEAQRVEARRLLALGRTADALEAAESARGVAEQVGSALLQGECAAIASEALRLIGQVGPAAARVAEAERIFRSLGAVAHLARLSARGDR